MAVEVLADLDEKTKASTMYSRSARKSSSVSYVTVDSSFFLPSAKLPGLMRIFSGLGGLDGHLAEVHVSTDRDVIALLEQALTDVGHPAASLMPTTVIRTM